MPYEKQTSKQRKALERAKPTGLRTGVISDPVPTAPKPGRVMTERVL